MRVKECGVGKRREHGMRARVSQREYEREREQKFSGESEREREKEKKKNGGKVIFKKIRIKRRTKENVWGPRKHLATEWDKGDKKSCEMIKK